MIFDKGFFEAMSKGEPYFGHIELSKQYDWSIIDKLIEVETPCNYGEDWKRHNLYIQIKDEYIIPECELIANDMRKIFYDHAIDSQIFANETGGKSTLMHQDKYDVMFLQLQGTVQTLGVLMEPGDWVWYPRDLPHSIEHNGQTRISLSIGVDNKQNKKRKVYQNGERHLDPRNPINYYDFEEYLK